MTYILDRVNSEVDKGRIKQLENELERVQNAFEEYITTTEGLEIDVKRELLIMQKKLNLSTSANEELVKRLRGTENLIRTSRLSAEATREKLNFETKLRREAEKALTEAELELRSMSVRFKQQERNESSTLRIVDSGIITEMVNNTSKGSTNRELDAVTEELMITQQKLEKTEQQLKGSQRQVQDLKRKIEDMGYNTIQSVSSHDKELLRELDEIMSEVDAGRGDVLSQPVVTKPSTEYPLKPELQLKESQEFNSRLIQEASCLRNILCDRGTFKYLRQHIEKTLYENMDLQEKLNKLVSSSQTIMESKEELTLENDVTKLKGQLHVAHQNLENAIEEACERNVVQQEDRVEVDTKGEIEDDIIGVKFATDLTPYAEGVVIDAKFRQNQRMLEESQEECSRMRSEILSLTESLYHAKHNCGETMILNEVVKAREEVEDKNKEIISLQNTLMSTQKEIRSLSEEISRMNSLFEKTQDVHNLVVEELYQTKNALAGSKDMNSSPEAEMNGIETITEKLPQKNVEIFLLRTQFEKLNEKNEILARQIKDAEDEIFLTREKQENASSDTKSRLRIAEELQENIDQTLTETHQRNIEVEELMLTLENRMRITEQNVASLQNEIELAMKTFQRMEQKSSNWDSEQSMSVVSQDDATHRDNHPVLNGTTDKDQEVGISLRQSALVQSKGSPDFEKTSDELVSTPMSENLESDSQMKDDDPTTMKTSPNKSKYNTILQRISNYQSFLLGKEDNAELEARGDVCIEERE